MTCSYSAAVAVRTRASTRPSIGETLSSSLPLPNHSPQKAPGLVWAKPSFFSKLAGEGSRDFMTKSMRDTPFPIARPAFLVGHRQNTDTIQLPAIKDSVREPFHEITADI